MAVPRREREERRHRRQDDHLGIHYTFQPARLSLALFPGILVSLFLSFSVVAFKVFVFARLHTQKAAFGCIYKFDDYGMADWGGSAYRALAFVRKLSYLE